ncbi:PREDICTED: uncharacterized protein LOC104747263 [Camelina sativa]|uniref:Uncharacterized protein LOC104747263 n=1 Tax=Camelina sativa TaxID=90675 RepID=A0ABM0W8D4_CAMSA|nr:PREDICTED: uncharacterized protein LOC104747263 [Camelina sativa]
MKVTVKNHGNEVCVIEVFNFDTVLAIKEKIERNLGIPVSKQTLFFKGKLLLQDHLNAAQCKIVNKSSLELFSSSYRYNPNHNNNDQVLRQTQQSPAPSNLTQQIIHGHQDWPVMVRSDTNESSLPSNLSGELLGSQDVLPPVTVGSSRNRNEAVRTEKSPVTSDSVEELLGQDWSKITLKKNNNEPLSLREMEELLGVQDTLPPVQSSTSDSVKEIINIPGSPVKKKIKIIPFPSIKLTVFVQPFEETRKIRMEVNANDRIKELRKELVGMQNRGELDLPRQGYFFVHKQKPLAETMTFFWYGVAEGDTIEISRTAV